MQDENLGQMYDLKFSSSFINIYEKIWQLFNNIFYVIWYIQNITSACNRYTLCEDTLKDPTDCGGQAMPSLLDGVGWEHSVWVGDFAKEQQLGLNPAFVTVKCVTLGPAGPLWFCFFICAMMKLIAIGSSTACSSFLTNYYY